MNGLWLFAIFILGWAQSGSSSEIAFLEVPECVEIKDVEPITSTDLLKLAEFIENGELPIDEISWLSSMGISSGKKPSALLLFLNNGLDSELVSKNSREFVVDAPLNSLENYNSADEIPSDGPVFIVMNVGSDDTTIREATEKVKSTHGPNVLSALAHIPPIESGRSRRAAEGGKQQPGNISSFKNGENGVYVAVIGLVLVMAVAIYVIAASLWTMEDGSDSIVYKMTNAKMNKRD